MSKSIFIVFAFACLSLPVGVFAEGSDKIPNQMLDNAVVVIEIVDFTIETFVWTGPGTVSLTPPTGIPVTLSSGQVFAPTQNGDFSMVVSNRATFDFSVKDGAGKEIPGRVSSTLWELSQGIDLTENLNGSFFAAIPSGIADTAVIELKLEGFKRNG